MNGRMAFVALAVATALGIVGAASASPGSDRDRGRVSCVSHATWTGIIRFTTPEFLAIRPSPKTVTVSSKGRTIVGT